MTVFTIVQNEPVFFPLWYGYYSRHFDPGDIHVLHHPLPRPHNASQERRKASWDAFISKHHKDHGYNLTEIHNDLSFDHQWLLQVVSQKQRELLRSGWTLFTEVDEIVVPHPGTGLDLKSYAEQSLRRTPTTVCDGFEVLHRTDKEPPLDLTRPILSQRRWWYRSRIYSKPLLSRVPLHWCCGFHACDEVPNPDARRDPMLVLIHLHKMDWDVCLSRHHANLDRRLCEDNMGFQNRIVEEAWLRDWWSRNIDTGLPLTQIDPIPEEFKTVI